MMDGDDVSQDNTRKVAGAERGHIVIRDMSVIFGEGPDQFIAVDRVSVDIAAGEFLCIVGPSGCGKSTVMNAIAGFEFPTEGSVTLDGAPIEGPGADRGMVFQQPTLFPWKNVRANVAHGRGCMAGATPKPTPSPMGCWRW